MKPADRFYPESSSAAFALVMFLQMDYGKSFLASCPTHQIFPSSVPHFFPDPVICISALVLCVSDEVSGDKVAGLESELTKEWT